MALKGIGVEVKRVAKGYKFYVDLRYTKAEGLLVSTYTYRTEESAKSAAHRFIQKEGIL